MRALNSSVFFFGHSLPFKDLIISVFINNFCRIKGGIRLFLVIFSLFGFFTFDLVYLFSVFNYAAQAEMCVYLLWDITRLIRENKYDHVDVAIKVCFNVSS